LPLQPSLSCVQLLTQGPFTSFRFL
jgi:L-fuconate dehydratase